MRCLLALDPGISTGWSFWRLHDDAPIEHVDHGIIAGGNKGFIRWARDCGWDEAPPAGLRVVSETFIFDGRTRKPELEPLKVEGALDALFPGWIGQRNVFKAHAPDDLLKEHGLWWPGAGHDRDSARHAIAYAKTHGHMPTIRRFWPPT